MRLIGTLMVSLLVCCLFAFSPAGAQIAVGISVDIALAAVAGLRSAADTGGWLYLDTRLLGLG